MTTEKQQTVSSAQPPAELQWLQRLVGDWTQEGEAVMEPGKPPVKITGTETVRAFGDAWIVSEGKAQTPDGQHIIMLGYNPQKRRFVGTFVDSGTPHLWVYDGSLAGDTLTLESEGPSMADDGTMATYRDVIEIVSDDHWVLRSLMPSDDGTWTEFMAMHQYRKK